MFTDRFLFDQHGSSLIESSVTLSLLGIVMVGAADFGRGYFAAIEVQHAAESAALYGTVNPADSSGMQSAARLDAHDLNSLQVNVQHGCECADGSASSADCSAPPTCSANLVQFVEVDTALAYVPMLRYAGVPSVFNLSGKSRMRTGS